MMKNRTNIILIAVVVAIWALVGLKATGKLFSGDETMEGVEETVVSAESSPQKWTNEKLQLNYPDPFLGTTARPEVKKQTSNQISVTYTPKVKIEKPITNEAPIVRFFGLVRNTGTNKMVAIVSISNQEKRMLAGETYKDIKLEKITRDSILVSWSKNKWYVKK